MSKFTDSIFEVPNEDLDKVGKQASDILAKSVQSEIPYEIAASVNFDTGWEISDINVVTVYLSFDEMSVRRQSLYPKGYPNGVDIIALFTNGYAARRYVYGYRHGVWQRSIRFRASDDFIRRSVEIARTETAAIAGVIGIGPTVWLNGEYGRYFR